MGGLGRGRRWVAWEGGGGGWLGDTSFDFRPRDSGSLINLCIFAL